MRILVTGATGNIGRMVVGHLVEAGGCTVRALTVDPARAALLDGVEVAVGSVRRPETLPAALEGVDALYLAPAPPTVAAVMEHVRAAGVRHVVDVELLDRIAAALGRPLQFVRATRDETVAVLEPVMGSNAGWYVDNVLGGYNALGVDPVPTVPEVTGRPATTFATWATTHVHRFR